MAKERIVTGIDIGASKIRCLIGKKNNQGKFDIIGCGVIPHNYIKKGAVADLKGLSDAIGKAVYKAEDESGKKVQSAYINAADQHTEGIWSNSEIVISDRDSEITRFDTEKVTKDAKSISIPYEREIFYTVHNGYTVDDEKGIVDPAGTFGFKLRADLYLITVKAALIENLKKAVLQTGISVAGTVISSVPTSLSCLSQHEKKIGTVLIDMGADLTEISIYTEGLLRYIKILPTGGNEMTDKISHQFRLPLEVAEKVKTEEIALDEEYADDDKIILKVDSRQRVIYKKELQALLQDLYKNMFISIKEAANKSGIFRDASNGVVLTGGASVMEGAAEIAEIEFGCPVRVGHITQLGTSSQPLVAHIFATAVGLVKYGFKEAEKRKNIIEKGTKNAFASIIDYARSLYREYF